MNVFCRRQNGVGTPIDQHIAPHQTRNRLAHGLRCPLRIGSRPFLAVSDWGQFLRFCTELFDDRIRKRLGGNFLAADGRGLTSGGYSSFDGSQRVFLEVLGRLAPSQVTTSALPPASILRVWRGSGPPGWGRCPGSPRTSLGVHRCGGWRRTHSRGDLGSEVAHEISVEIGHDHHFEDGWRVGRRGRPEFDLPVLLFDFRILAPNLIGDLVKQAGGRLQQVVFDEAGHPAACAREGGFGVLASDLFSAGPARQFEPLGHRGGLAMCAVGVGVFPGFRAQSPRPCRGACHGRTGGRRRRLAHVPGGHARGMSLRRHPFADVKEIVVECCSSGVEDTEGGQPDVWANSIAPGDGDGNLFAGLGGGTGFLRGNPGNTEGGSTHRNRGRDERQQKFVMPRPFEPSFKTREVAETVAEAVD